MREVFCLEKKEIQRRGKRAEIYAKSYLQRQGLRCITTNYRCRFGEIDLILLDKAEDTSSAYADCVVFVEVKLRQARMFHSAQLDEGTCLLAQTQIERLDPVAWDIAEADEYNDVQYGQRDSHARSEPGEGSLGGAAGLPLNYMPPAAVRANCVTYTCKQYAWLIQAASSVGKRKQQRILHTASHFIQQSPRFSEMPLRFDVCALDGYNMYWVKHAFMQD